MPIVEAICEFCGRAYLVNLIRRRGRFCSRACYGRWLSADRSRIPHLTPLTKGHTIRRYKSLPVTKVCPTCERPFSVKKSHADRRTYCSKRCMAIRQSSDWLGPGNPRWRGGPVPYYGPSWLAARGFVRQRDRVCQSCGKTARRNGKALDVHHRIPFRTFGVDRHAEANDPTNLIALCAVCHTREEWGTTRRA